MSLDTLIEHAESVNIAEDLNEDYLTSLGAQVVRDYQIDKQSRAEWERRNDEATKLAAQVVEDKSSPWTGAANVKYPLLTEAAIQFNARAYAALVPGADLVSSRVVGFDPTGAKLEQGTRVAKHMSYQLLEQMEEWEEEMDSLLLALPILGCMFKKTYYDPILERNKSELIYPKDLVVDYYTRSLEQSYRKTHVIPYNDNDIAIMVANGIYLDRDLSAPAAHSDELKDEIYGLSAPSAGSGVERHVLEQHTYLDLDDAGMLVPYIVTVDAESEVVLRIVAGYDPDKIKTNDKQDVVYVPQRQYFTKYSFMPSSDGSFYDLGFGNLLAPINHTVDTLINQLLDAGTLSNLQSGFLSRGVRVKSGSMRFRPGEWKQVNSTGDDLRKGIFPLPVREPSNVLFQLLNMMTTAGQRLASTVDSMVGENPGQNQKATTTMAVLDQGQKVFHGIYRRLHRSFAKELKKLFTLNSEYLSPEEYFNVLDAPVDNQQAAQILQQDYNPDSVNVIPSADVAVSTSQQKLMKAQALLELLPSGLVNELEAVKRVLTAQEQPSIDMLIKEPQPPQPDPAIELEKQKHDDNTRLAWAKVELEAIKAEQADIEMQSRVILNLAKAEGEEEGIQINTYRAQLEGLKQRSEAVGQRAALMRGKETPQ